MFLVHGPQAHDKAIVLVKTKYDSKILEDLGKDGLKAQEARDLVNLLQSNPLGGPYAIIIGPIDLAADKSCDVLLKTLEEGTYAVKCVLWANDLGSVRPTVKSRCIPIWSGGTSLLDPTLLADVRMIYLYAKEGKWASLLSLLDKYDKSDYDVTLYLAEVLYQENLDYWDELRELLSHSNVTRIELVHLLFSLFIPKL